MLITSLLITTFFVTSIKATVDSDTNVRWNNESLTCFKGWYKIPLWSKRSLPIVLNRERLMESQIKSIVLHAQADDFKALQLQNDIEMITVNLNLTNSSAKYESQLQTQPITIFNLSIYANYLNRTYVNYSVQLIDDNGEIQSSNCSVPVLILPPDRLTTKFYLKSIPFIVIFVSIQMGILLELEVLKEIVRRPIAVAIGFFCQYGVMPMLAFALTRIFRYPPLYGFALFVVGCCPGGSASNQLTVIFDGDLNLSVLMSFASIVTSFIMMPLWLYTLGTYGYLKHLQMHIPFRDLAKSLGTTLVPLGIGMLLVHFIPKLKSPVKRIVKPVFITLLFYFFGFGTYVNFYLFTYIDWKMALTAPLLPWIGYILGGIVAWILGQDWIRIKTIGIETGIQNVGIAFMVLLYSLPEPENNQATVIAMIISYLSAQPFYAVLLFKVIRNKCCKKKLNKPEIDDQIDDVKENLTVSETRETDSPENSSSPSIVKN